MTPLKLFAFPPAGSNISFFRGWQAHLPAHVRLEPVEYPGRGTRYRHAPPPTLAALVEQLRQELEPKLRGGPFAFLGHSLGAMVAFELTRALRATREPLPLVLYLSGRQAPNCVDEQPVAHTMSDEALVEYLRELGGVPPEVLGDADFLSYFLPGVRADFALGETHTFASEPALPVPITVLSGRGDPRGNPAQMAGWRSETLQAFRLEEFPGDHFFVSTVTREVLQKLELPLPAGA